MDTCRRAYHLLRRACLCQGVLLVLFGLAACGTPGQRSAAATPSITSSEMPAAMGPAATAKAAGPMISARDPEVEATPLAPTAAPALAPTSVAASGVWQTYRNTQGGYTIDYPVAWSMDQRTGTDGALVTTFTPADGGAGIEVIVKTDEGNGAESADIPNTRCEPVTIHGLSGTRCFDTISFSISTTLVGRGKTYIIAASGKRLDQNIYQRLLDSFRIVS